MGEAGWLLGQPRSATVVALRDSEMLCCRTPCSKRPSPLSRANSRSRSPSSARADCGAATAAIRRARRTRVCSHSCRTARKSTRSGSPRDWVEELQGGARELVWDVRATTHTSDWFSRLEELNDYVVYVADPGRLRLDPAMLPSGGCDLGSGARGGAGSRPGRTASPSRGRPRRAHRTGAAASRGIGSRVPRARWLQNLARRLASPHRRGAADLGRVARLLTRRGVGLVLVGRRRPRLRSPRRDPRAARGARAARFRRRREHRRPSSRPASRWGGATRKCGCATAEASSTPIP